MECTVCDKVVVNGANFCPDCGTPFDRASATKSSVTFAHVEVKSSKIPSFAKSIEKLSAALKNAEKICKRYGGNVENETRNGITVELRDNPIGQTSAELAASAALEIKDHHRKRTPAPREKADVSVSVGKILSLEGDTNRSSRFVNSAAVLYKSCGMALQEALCYVALADLSDPNKAAEYYSKATWLLENSGADRWVEKYGRRKPKKGFREEIYRPAKTTTIQPVTT